jgi:hypothetical protein
VLLLFTINDEPQFGKNNCERAALAQIAASPGNIVKLATGCPVMSWKVIRYAEESRLNGRLLTRWHVTDRDKLYYNE